MRDHPALRQALKLRQLLAAGSWASYFKTALEAPYLLAALAHLYFPALRVHALRVLARTNGEDRPGPTLQAEPLLALCLSQRQTAGA